MNHPENKADLTRISTGCEFNLLLVLRLSLSTRLTH